VGSRLEYLPAVIVIDDFQNSGQAVRITRGTPALSVIWIGVVLAATFSIIVTWGLIGHLRNPIMEEVSATVWNLDGPPFYFWAFARPLGSVLASLAAFVYAIPKPPFPWLAGVEVLGTVLGTNLLRSQVYSPPLFGVGGATILISFFAIVWIWLKRYGALRIQERISGSYRLIVYLFWISAPWFLCGETGRLHFKAKDRRCQSRSRFCSFWFWAGCLSVLVSEYHSWQLEAA
jgi:hypothetical protein